MKHLLCTLGLFLFTTTAFSLEADSVSGFVNGYDVTNNDDKVNFGLVMPTQSKEDFFNFSIDSIMSSQTDTLTAVGQSFEVPSNLSLPEQRERYLFFTVRLNKPDYILPIKRLTPPKYLGVLEGSFPFKSTVDKIRGGAPIFSVINDFNINSFTVNTLIGTELDLTVGENPIGTSELVVKSPSSVNENYLILAVNLFPVEENLFMPIDLKQMEVDSSQNLKSIEDIETTTAFIQIPKALLEGKVSEEVFSKPFNYSLAWNKLEIDSMLPTGDTYMTYDNNQLLVDKSKLSSDFSLLGYKITYLAEDSTVISSKAYLDAIPEALNLEDLPMGTKRLRVDVFAIDSDPIVATFIKVFYPASQIATLSSYISRYETDLN